MRRYLPVLLLVLCVGCSQQPQPAAPATDQGVPAAAPAVGVHEPGTAPIQDAPTQTTGDAPSPSTLGGGAGTTNGGNTG